MFFKKNKKTDITISNSAESAADNRRHKRHNVSWDTKLVKSKVGLVNGAIKNISESGVGVYAEFSEDLEIGDTYMIEFNPVVNGRDFTMHLQVKVMYRLPLLGDMDYSYGLQFVALNEKAQKNVNRLIKSLSLVLPV